MSLAWITGGGQGIGKAIALELAKRGWTVVVSSRTEGDLNQVADESDGLSGKVIPVTLDVTDRDAVAEAVTHIEGTISPIDLAILNAGTYIRFGAEDFSATETEKQFAVNVIGTVNCLDPVLASMRQRKAGQIAVVSSLTACRGLPYASAYGASKAALTNMCEALKPELDAIGIDLRLIHPGFVETPLTDKNDFPMPFLVTAKDAARRIVSKLERNGFEITFPWRLALLIKLGRILPYRLYFAITRKMVKP